MPAQVGVRRQYMDIRHVRKDWAYRGHLEVRCTRDPKILSGERLSEWCFCTAYVLELPGQAVGGTERMEMPMFSAARTNPQLPQESLA